MSIIYEALKKTQNSPKNITAGIAPYISQKQNPKKSGKIPYALASVIVIGFGLIFLVLERPEEKGKTSVIRKSKIKNRLSPRLSWLYRDPDISGRKGLVLSSSFSPLSSDGSPKEEKNPRKFQPDFVVNGIVISPDGNIALINDQIIRAGDIIEGVRVERIEDSRVVVFYDGQEVVLRSK